MEEPRLVCPYRHSLCPPKFRFPFLMLYPGKFGNVSRLSDEWGDMNE
jgi:hypothetical protein